MNQDFLIQSVLVFLEGAKKRGKLKPDFVERIKKKCLALEDIDALNPIINEINKALPKEEIPYPAHDSASSLFEVKGQIFAFQNFLRGKLDEKKIKIENQVPLFKQATRLWAYVGDTIPPENGIKEFAELIEKTNEFFPENERYPTIQE